MGFDYVFFFQAEDGIRDAQESRGLGDVYKRQSVDTASLAARELGIPHEVVEVGAEFRPDLDHLMGCLLYTSPSPRDS